MGSLREPKFMREIHRVRAELSELSAAEYEKYLKGVKEKYAERLKRLYVDLPVIRVEQKLETTTH